MRLLLIVCSLIGLLLLAVIVVTTQPSVSPIASSPPAVDPSRLKAHVRYLSEEVYPRSYDQLQQIDRAAHYIHEQLQATGASVSVQEVTVQGVSYKNIIARFGPATGPTLVVGAHYDSNGESDAQQNTTLDNLRQTHTPGADDNASGVAGLIELSRLLAGQQHSHSIELVAYTLEEMPHFRTEDMGSSWHARTLKKAQRDVRLMLSLEMIGYFSDLPSSQDYPLPFLSSLYSDRGNFVALVGKLGDFAATRRAKAIMLGATDLPVYSINTSPLVPGIDYSDYQSYWKEGMPALMVTDTAFLRNKHYHLASDTYEKLDYARMAKVVQAVYAVVQGY